MPAAVLIAHLPGKHDQSSHAHGGAGVRASLAQAKTVDEVNAAAGAEAKRITGRTTTFDMAGSDVKVAREHAEGVLLGMERYPNVRVGQVVTYGPGGARPDVFAGQPKIDSVYAATHIAPTQPGGVIFVETIGFNARYAGDSPRYRAGLDHDVTAGYVVKGGPKSTGAHEYGHLAANQTASANPAMRVVSDRARTAGVAPSMLIREQVSGYAATSKHELMAEAFADVVLHGPGASDASHAVVAEMDAGYARIFPTVGALVAADPGQPYVSPDDLNSIIPLWQAAVAEHVTPVVAEVFRDTADQLHAQLVNVTDLPQLPSVSSLAAETYLSQAVNTFEQVGDELWETARTQLLEGFQKGESIPELATRLRASSGLSAKTAVLVARTQVLDASNAASIATARVSGIPMRKGWLDTPDLRTRESHLLAGSTYGTDEQMVDLDAQFTVGGYSCDRPHDPVLPPSERYNCFPGHVQVDASNVRRAYRRWYDGDLVEVVDREGRQLAGTPNHPILTDRGWVPLGELKQGDQLICYRAEPDPVSTHDIHASPTSLEEVFDALVMRGGRQVRVGSHRVDFHGERPDGDVDVVSADGELRDAVDASIQQGIEEFLLPSTYEGSGFLSAERRAGQRVLASGGATYGHVSCGGQPQPLLTGGLGHSGKHGSTAPPALDAPAFEQATERGPGDPAFDSQGLLGLAGQITFNEVVGVVRVPWSGHVYNLETETGAYVANGILAHNCRCSLAFSVSDDDVADARALHTPEPPLPNTSGQASTGMEDLEQDVRAAAAGEGIREQLAGGAVGTVERVTLPNGRELFGKESSAWFNRSGEEITDAEELASALGRAINAPVPRVIRDGPRHIYTDWAPGKVGHEYFASPSNSYFDGPVDTDFLRAVVDSGPGRRLGLFDMLTQNQDRHNENWLVTVDGTLTGIDHGTTWWFDEFTLPGEFLAEGMQPGDPAPFEQVVRGGLQGPFVRDRWFDQAQLEDTGRAVPVDTDVWTPGDVVETRRRLQLLRPDFLRLGHGDWLDYSLRVLDLLEPHATGSESIFDG